MYEDDFQQLRVKKYIVAKGVYDDSLENTLTLHEQIS